MNQNKVNNLLAAGSFFIACPIFSLFGLNITFYIFGYILLNNLYVFRNNGFYQTKYFLHFIVVLISLISSFSIYELENNFFSDFFIIVQYFYWLLLSYFISLIFSSIDIKKVGKWILIGTILSFISYFVFKFKIDLVIFKLDFSTTRNDLLFRTIIFYPFIFIFLTKIINSKKYINLINLCSLFIVIMTNGRMGSFLFFIVIIFITVSINRKMFSIFFASLCLLFFISNLSYLKNNYRVFNVLENEKTAGSLTEDKSWGQRQLMVLKGVDIFNKHPILGIGLGHFRLYNTELNFFLKDFSYLNKSVDYYNQRSSHNSYISILSETGIIGFLTYFLILLSSFKLFFKLFFKRSFLINNNLILFPLPLVLIYFYFISANVGTLIWVVFGIYNGLKNEYESRRTLSHRSL